MSPNLYAPIVKIAASPFDMRLNQYFNSLPTEMDGCSLDISIKIEHHLLMFCGRYLYKD
jgi:ribosomal protein L32